MPQFPRYTAEIPPPVVSGGLPQPSAAPYHGLEEIGRTISTLGEKLDDARRNRFMADQMLNLTNILGNKRLFYETDPDIFNHQTDAQAFADNVLKKFDEMRVDQRTRDVLMPRARIQVEDFLLNQKQSNITRQIQYHIKNDSEWLPLMGDAAARSPDNESKQAVMDYVKTHLEGQAAAGVYSAPEAATLLKRFNENTAVMTAQQDILNDPVAAVTDLEANVYGLPEEHRLQLLQHARIQAEHSRRERLIEREHQERIAEKQTNDEQNQNFFTLYNAIDQNTIPGPLQAIEDAVRNRDIAPHHGEALINHTYQTKIREQKGEKLDDPDYVNDLLLKMDRGENISRDITEGVHGGQLQKRETISSLLNENHSRQREEPITPADRERKKPGYGEAKDYIRRTLTTTDPVSRIQYPDNPQKTANALLYFEQMVDKHISIKDALSATMDAYPSTHNVHPKTQMRAFNYNIGTAETSRDIPAVLNALALRRKQGVITPDQFYREYQYIMEYRARLEDYERNQSLKPVAPSAPAPSSSRGIQAAPQSSQDLGKSSESED